MTDLSPVSRHKAAYQVCSRCVMDTSAADISFDAGGVCNYCGEYLVSRARYLREDPVERQHRLDALLSRVRADGRGKPYDCIIGVSGGVDSSWVLALAVDLGLRPLAVHMDNGWNAELAQNNIANLVRGLGVDLHTQVIDWPEYRGLMEAFFAADVTDVELLYDNAVMAVNFGAAARHRQKYILGGTNVATEGMRMPPGWNWFKYDKRNIKAIARRFGGPRLDTFPAIGTLDFIQYHLRGIRWLSFLDYTDYRKMAALQSLQGRFGYKPYPFKHYESVFTRFYQGFILPTKFGIDKRRLHFSTLIMNGEMTRDEATAALEGIPYESEKLLHQDTAYFLKKMGWSRDKLEQYLARPPIPHDSYPSERPLWERLLEAYRRMNEGDR
jgi:N-acetyl sugar amidotransferase